MNYQSQQIGARMRLEEALNNFSGDICYLTLKDGTNIEIIQNNQPQISRNMNFNYNDEFIEENLEENFNNFNYPQIIQNQPLALRGRDQKKKFGKLSLRKTVLKSLKGNEKEKKFPAEGKLRNLNENLIFQQTDNNEFLQCANCHQFFLSEENEKNENNPQIPNKQQIPSNPQNNQFKVQNQQQKKIISQNQQKPHPQQNKPGQIITQNNQKQQFYQQVSPQQNKRGQIPNQKLNINQGNLRNNQQPIAMQFRGQNPVFRARKKVTNRYDSNNDRYFNSKNLSNINNNAVNYYYYPVSGKKTRKENMLCEECSSKKKMAKNVSHRNINVTRNLNYGFERVNQESGYTDNNLSEFLNNNEEYYEYPSEYHTENINQPGFSKANNQKIVTIKTFRNQYQDYDEYY